MSYVQSSHRKWVWENGFRRKWFIGKNAALGVGKACGWRVEGPSKKGGEPMTLDVSVGSVGGGRHKGGKW